jgi:hypothetical protein
MSNNVTESPSSDLVLKVEDREKFIAELNEKTSNDNGEWIYINDDIGVVWRPDAQALGVAPEVPQPATPPPSLVELANWGKSIDFDNITKNSVVVIKINSDNPYYMQGMQQAIARQVLSPRAEKLKANSVCVLFMQAGDDLSVMSEEEMNQAGWEKKQKSLIVIPGRS